MITVIYILLGIIVLTIVALWHDTYVNEKYLSIKMTDEEKKTFLRTYRRMVEMNESDYILGNITKKEYEKNLKEISKKLDWYERNK